MLTIRAVLAVGLLGGYWVGRWVVPLGLLVVAAGAWNAGAVWPATLLTAVTLLAAGLSVRAARAVRRAAHREPVGVPLPPRSDSPLWSEVRLLCARLEVRLPEEIRIGTGPTIEVTEQTRRLGLVGGPRRLCVGLPVLVGLPPAQVRALLTHELAHDSCQAGRLPAVCHRARATVGMVLARRPRTAGVVFAAVARLFLAVGSAVGRAQEFRADHAAVRVAGRAGTAGALRELPVLAVAWRRYLAEVIAPAVRSGYAPLSLSDGFHHTRRRWDAELAPSRTAPADSTRPPWDVHPSRLDRLHAIDLAPEPTPEAVPWEWRPSLMAAVREAEREVTGADVRRVPWDEFVAIGASQQLRDEVGQLYRAAGEIAATGERADLDTVLGLLETRALPELIARLRPATTVTARHLLAVAFALAAVDAGAGRWRHSRSGTLQVVRGDGGAIPVEELAARVIADPSTTPMVRQALRAVQVAHART